MTATNVEGELRVKPNAPTQTLPQGLSNTEKNQIVKHFYATR